jgi:hypothetical protein
MCDWQATTRSGSSPRSAWRQAVISEPSYADQLARYRAHAFSALPMPQDLASWALRQLEQLAPADYQRLRRDQHLRSAGALIGGAVRFQAAEIHRRGERIARTWRLRVSLRGPDVVDEEITAAMCLSPLPRERQLRVILAKRAAGAVATARPAP